MQQRAFDETAEGWDATIEAYVDVFAPFTAQFAEHIVRLYPPQRTEAVLELAAGTGSLTRELWPLAGSLVASDISPLMVDRIADAVRAAGKTNVDVDVMDAHSLDVADASYDAVYCMFGVMFFSDRAKAFAEMARVLRPEGRCVISTWNERSGILRPLASALAAVMPGSPPAQSLSEPPVLGSFHELQRELSAAGLEDLEVSHAACELRLAQPKHYLERLLMANPNGVMMKSRLPAELFERVAGQLEADLREKFGDGPVVLEGVANVACAHKPS